MLRIAFFLLLVPLAAAAQTRTEAAFSVKIAGITVGSMSLSGAESGNAYSVAARIVSAGAARVFRDFSYVARANGALSRGRFVPVHYEEQADTGRRQSESILDYARGVPRVTRYTSPKPAGPDSPAPATQGGTLDPLTALFAVLRDQPQAGICNDTLILFDGKRRSRIALGAPKATTTGVVCHGEYRRLQGFTAEEVSRHRTFPVTVHYAPAGGGLMRAVRVDVQSVYGLATLVRR